jgi:hypothetical protein
MYFMVMKRKVTNGRQVSLLSGIRKKLHTGSNAVLQRKVEDNADRVKVFRGSGKKGLVKQLLKDRRQEREKEHDSHK